MTYDEDDIDTTFCHCEDPYNVGHRLLLCGKAVCLRLRGLMPTPTLIREIIIKSVDDPK